MSFCRLLRLFLAGMLVLALFVSCAKNGPQEDVKNNEEVTEGENTVAPIRESEGLAFQASADGASCGVVGMGSCKDTQLVIPAAHEGRPVTFIAADAFKDRAQLVSITLPASIERVGASAFYGCTGLSGVCITDLAGWCAIEFENSAANPLGCAKKLYLDGTQLTELEIPAGVTKIGALAFAYFTDLRAVTIPPSVISIEKYAFLGCSHLSELRFAAQSELVRVATYAFGNCTSLSAFSLPTSVTQIGEGAFYNTAWYGDQADGMVYVGDIAYKYKGAASGTADVVLREGTTAIADAAFYHCTALSSVTLPTSVAYVGADAFRGCTSLTIYCRAASQPSGWSATWNPTNRPVVWNYTE